MCCESLELPAIPKTFFVLSAMAVTPKMLGMLQGTPPSRPSLRHPAVLLVTLSSSLPLLHGADCLDVFLFVWLGCLSVRFVCLVGSYLLFCCFVCLLSRSLSLFSLYGMFPLGVVLSLLFISTPLSLPIPSLCCCLLCVTLSLFCYPLWVSFSCCLSMV